VPATRQRGWPRLGAISGVGRREAGTSHRSRWSRLGTHRPSGGRFHRTGAGRHRRTSSATGGGVRPHPPRQFIPISFSAWSPEPSGAIPAARSLVHGVLDGLLGTADTPGSATGGGAQLGGNSPKEPQAIRRRHRGRREGRMARHQIVGPGRRSISPLRPAGPPLRTPRALPIRQSRSRRGTHRGSCRFPRRSRRSAA
jgi:hypothetical protein